MTCLSLGLILSNEHQGGGLPLNFGRNFDFAVFDRQQYTDFSPVFKNGRVVLKIKS